MKRFVLIYGLITGAILCAFVGIGILMGSFEIDASDSGYGEIIGFSTFILAFVFVYFGIKAYRDKERKGSISFLQGLGTGCLIALIASLMYAVTWDVYIFTSNPTWYEKYAQITEDSFKESDTFSEIKYEQLKSSNEQMVEMAKNPVLLTGMTMLEPLPVGILAAIISALLLRRRKKESSE